MIQLTLILRDFHPPEEAPGDAHTRLARYPVLEQALRQARSEAPLEGWRRWLMQHVGVVSASAMPGAMPSSYLSEGAIAAQVRPETLAAPSAWLATPVHYVAGLDTVRLHPAGVLQLSENEQQLLAQDFARVFTGSSLGLWALGEREMLLSAPLENPIPATSDPSRYLGRVPSAGMPGGTEAGWLRRLGAETEMWLHEHPVNQQRAEAGQLPLSALWFWGGGRPVKLRSQGLPKLYGSDLFARGLWQSGGSVPSALPENFAALGRLAGDSILLLPTLRDDGRTDLAAVESAWLAPALAALDRSQLDLLRLVIAEHSFVLGRHRSWRWWRRARPWWEQLA